MASSTREAAERTVAHYLSYKGEQGRIEEVDGSFVVYRVKDNKILKSMEYSPASLARLVQGDAEEAALPLATGDAAMDAAWNIADG